MPSLKRFSKKFFKKTKHDGSIMSVEHTPGPGTASTVRGALMASPDTASVEHPQGLEVVYEDPDASLDIVAVHGLNGHRETTWTAANGVHWLRDLLPKDLHGIRVLAWGYDANTHSRNGVSCQYLYDHAQDLVTDLSRKRDLTESVQRPIIFLAHSLGGIVVKSALIHSDAARRGALEAHRSVKVSTHGVIYMGTPHQGGNGVPLGRSLVAIASIFVPAGDHLLKHLERDSELLQQQLGQYNSISGEFVTKFAYETYETPTILGRSMLVVPKASAVVPGHADAEPIAIKTDHIKMVKFSTSNDVGYVKISETLRDMAMTARENIQSRWEEEVRVREARDNVNRFEPPLDLSPDNVNRFELPLDLSSIDGAPRFVARTDELSQMDSILGKTGERRTVILHGLGGMGKTQLAREYIRRHRQRFSAVIWLNARDTSSLRQSFERAARWISRYHRTLVYMSNAIKSKDSDECQAAVKQWLDEPNNDRWLVVYDNYDNPQLGSTNPSESETDNPGDAALGVDPAFDIRSFLPNTFHGAVIITTRSSQVKLGECIKVTKLTNRKDAIEILASTSRRDILDGDPDADTLAQHLDGLPLALTTAGAYLEGVPSTTLKEYLKMYDESWLRLQKNSPQILSYDRAMYSTWNISYTHIERLNPASARLLDLWAYFDNEDLWFELLFDGVSSYSNSDDSQYLKGIADDRINFDSAIRLLHDYGLAEPATLTDCGSESQGYSMHGCVHSWTQHVLNAKQVPGMARLAAECVAQHVPRPEIAEYWLIQRRLLKHADRCWARMKNNMELRDVDVWIYGELGRLYSDQDRYAEAEEAYNRALQMELEDTPALKIIHDLGLIYRYQGRYAEANEMYDRALRGLEKTLGPEHMSTLRTVNNLGILYKEQGRHAEAEEMYDRALRGFEKTLGPEHMSTLDTVNNLGVLYAEQGRHAEAEKMYDRALRGLEKTLGPEHMSTLRTVSNLGTLYKEQGRHAEAEEMYGRAFRGFEKILGPEHVSMLRTVTNLGNLYVDQGRHGKAEEMYHRALRGLEKVLGPDNISTLKAFHNLGNLYAGQGRHGEAEELYGRALRGFEKALGPEHVLAVNTVYSVGVLYQKQGRYVEAEEMYNQALRDFERALGPEHKWTLNTVYKLSLFYEAQGRHAEAEAIKKRFKGKGKASLP